MRIVSLALKEFKGLDSDLRWASAIVLFGRNDSGKTNILEGIEFLFTASRPGRIDRFRQLKEPYPPEPEMIFELDALDLPGSRDQELFVRWLAELLPDWEAGSVLDELRRLVDEVPKADADAEAEPHDRAGALDEVARHYRDLGLQVAESLAIHAGDGVDRADAALLSEALTASNRFLMRGDETMWLTPEREQLAAEAQAALARIEAAADSEWEYPRELLPLANDGKFSEELVRITRFNFEQSGVETLYHELERFIDREMARRELGNFKHTEPIPIELFIDRFRWDPRGRRDPWLEGDRESFSLHPLVLEICDDLSECSNEIAPEFTTREYEIRIHPHTPNEWRFLGFRASVQLRPRSGSPGDEFDLAVASTGIATWVGYAVAEAIRLFEEEAARAANSQEQPTIFLLDEPERHLHPKAQKEVAAWVADRAATGAHVVIATHAAPFLQLPREDVEYYKVTRDDSHRSRTTRITGEISAAVSASAAEFGMSPATLIQLTRGWLVVEGEHDRLILEAFFGAELRSAWVQTLALRGASRAKATFITLQALKPLEIPFYVLLDNVRAEKIRGGEIPSGASEEERIAADLVRVAREESVVMTIYGLTYPDVVCMLPPEAVRRVAADLRAKPEAFKGWDDLIAAHERARDSTPAGTKAPDFKQFLLATIGLKGRIGTDEFLRRVIQSLQPDDRPHPELERIVAEVVAAATTQPTHSAVS